MEGKVTPRLAGLLDEIKDEKKVSLAVADPKLGMASRLGYRFMLTSQEMPLANSPVFPSN